MRVVFVPIRDFLCKLCKRILSDKKETVPKINLVKLSKLSQTKRTSEIYSSYLKVKVKHV